MASELLTREMLAEAYETWPLKERLLTIPNEIANTAFLLRAGNAKIRSATDVIRPIEAELGLHDDVVKGKNEAVRAATVQKLARENPHWVAAQAQLAEGEKEKEAAAATIKDHEREWEAWHDIVKLTVAEMNLATMCIGAPVNAFGFIGEVQSVTEAAQQLAG